MAWRLRLTTRVHYLDFEWGRQEVEVVQQQDSQPAMNDQPMQVYVEPLGFRFQGDGVFATEAECVTTNPSTNMQESA